MTEISGDLRESTTPEWPIMHGVLRPA